MNLLRETIERIEPVDRIWLEKAESQQLNLIKPPKSLGRLEEIANRLCAIQATLQPSVENRRIIVCAADHGVCAENVSPYPSEVTGQMVVNFLSGGAAINALAKVADAKLSIVDVGVKSAISWTGNSPNVFYRRRIADGTRNSAKEAAMSESETFAAIRVGIELAEESKRNGEKLLGLGEMGIGNTTAASAICAALTGLAPEAATGRGTGATDEMLRHKIETVRRALKINQPNSDDALEVLRKVGGFEIACLVGVCLSAARHRIAIVTDGFIATAATALAVKLCPSIGDYVFASHLSAEKGHGALLEFINQSPLFDLEMRLGEGTGAALAMNIIAAAVAAFCEMATFETAGISENKQTTAQ
jgi:nicotinate-nucleotide--dimethylbenzimidazole phosphoribosyltransferase